VPVTVGLVLWRHCVSVFATFMDHPVGLTYFDCIALGAQKAVIILNKVLFVDRCLLIICGRTLRRPTGIHAFLSSAPTRLAHAVPRVNQCAFCSKKITGLLILLHGWHKAYNLDVPFINAMIFGRPLRCRSSRQDVSVSSGT